jgi:hypothetical protein
VGIIFGQVRKNLGKRSPHVGFRLWHAALNPSPHADDMIDLCLHSVIKIAPTANINNPES